MEDGLLDRILWGSESCRLKSKSVIMSGRFEEFHFPCYIGLKIADLNHLDFDFHF